MWVHVVFKVPHSYQDNLIFRAVCTSRRVNSHWCNIFTLKALLFFINYNGFPLIWIISFIYSILYQNYAKHSTGDYLSSEQLWGRCCTCLHFRDEEMRHKLGVQSPQVIRSGIYSLPSEYRQSPCSWAPFYTAFLLLRIPNFGSFYLFSYYRNYIHSFFKKQNYRKTCCRK